MSNTDAERRRVVQRFHEEFLNTGDLSAADRFIAPDCVLYWAGQRQALRGPAAYRQLLKAVRDAFPDIRWTVEELVVENEKVVERARARATHLGAFMGVPASGRTVTLEGLALFTIENGKITSEWAMPNLFGLVEQIRASEGSPAGDDSAVSP